MEIRFYKMDITKTNEVKIRYLTPKSMADGTINKMDFVEMRSVGDILNVLDTYDLIHDETLEVFYQDLSKARNVCVYGKNKIYFNETANIFQVNIF